MIKFCVDFKTRLTCSKAVKNAVLAQDWMAVGADQHAGLRVPEDVVFLQQTCRGEELQLQRAGGKTRQQATRGRSSTSASVEDADPAISAVVNLVSSQRGVAVRLDPHPRHGVVKDLVVLDEAQTCWVKKKKKSWIKHTKAENM